MARQANLKTVISADASPMRSELAKARTDVKNFGKVSENALSSIGEAMGVNVGKIQQMTSAIQGMGQKMTKSSNEAVKGLGSMLKGVNALSAGIAGVGVGVLIAGFKSLKDEAENFSDTIDGLNMKMAQEAWISTYRQAMHDNLRALGQDTAEQMNSMQKWWTNLTTKAKTAFTGWFSDSVIDINWLDALTGTSGLVINIGKNIASANRAAKEAVVVADQAAEIGARQGETTKAEISNMVQLSELNARIAEYKRDMTDTSLSLAERIKALADAEEAIKSKYEIEISLARQKLDDQKALNSLANNSVEDTQKEAQLEVQLNDLLRQQSDEMRSLQRLSRSLTTEAGKQSAEYLNQLEAIRAIKESRRALADWSSATSTELPTFGTPQATLQVPVQIVPKVDKDNFQYLLDQNLGFATIRVGMELDQSKLHDISEQVKALVEQLTVSLSESIGQLVGDLVTGGDAWSNFASSALTAFADMAQSVGKMAISMGMTIIGIKAGLESLNPYVAIAAGSALVALGAAVKAGLKNVANGNYAASSSSVASSSYATSSAASTTGYNERERNIKVAGTLKASGSDLVTVLTNENKRRLATT